MKRCPECGSENIIDGELITSEGQKVSFCKKGTRLHLRPKVYRVSASACSDCGKIFDMRIPSESLDGAR